MNKKNLFWGFVLIVLAVYVLISRIGIIPDLPVGKILVSLICVYIMIKGVINRNFAEILIPLAVIGCQYDEVLGITKITPWPLLLAAVLISIGLSLIFPGKRKNGVNITYYSDGNGKTVEQNTVNGKFVEEGTQDGEIVHIENSFSGNSQYVNSQNLLRAKVENSFGQCNVYFHNATLKNGKATIEAENSFGETNLYIPGAWRVQIEQDVALGDVKVYGSGNADMDAPSVLVHAECSLGCINIYIE